MSDSTLPKPDINSWLEDEMYTQFLHDRKGVDEEWKDVFEANGSPVAAPNGADGSNGHAAKAAPPPASAPAPAATAPAPPAPAAIATKPPAAPAAPPPAPPASSTPSVPALHLGPSEQLVPLRGAAARLAANMTASLSVPTATSQRMIPVKVIEENRRLINESRALQGKSKVSYTHLMGWAIAQALKAMPALNDAYAEQNGEPFRLVRKQVNLGLAIDVARLRRVKATGCSVDQGRSLAHLRAVHGAVRRPGAARAQEQAGGGRFPGHEHLAHQPRNRRDA